MPVISVRISEEEKRMLKASESSLSEAVREGINLYLNTRRNGKILRKLEHLQQKDRAKTTTIEEVKLIRDDRKR